MKLLPTIEILMKEAARECTSGHFAEIEPEHLLIAILSFSELEDDFTQGKLDNEYLVGLLRTELLAVKTALQSFGSNAAQLRRDIRERMGTGNTTFGRGAIHRSAKTKHLFNVAADFAHEDDAPFLTAAHLLAAIMDEPTPLLAGLIPKPSADRSVGIVVEESVGQLQSWDTRQIDIGTKDLTDLAQMAKKLTQGLRARVCGQDAAIGGFVEGLFNAEMFVDEPGRRSGPKCTFIFAGPPGAGKSYLAECAAEILEKPFEYYDLDSLPKEEQLETLVGSASGNGNGSPGTLTGFVDENPHAFLLFSGIETADPGFVQVLGTILGHGRLQDRFLKREVDFGNTVVVVHMNLTNADYDTVRSAVLSFEDRELQRKALREYLESESRAHPGNPLYSTPLLSMLDEATPLLFKQLGLHELIRIAEAQIHRVASLVQAQYLKKLECRDDVPLCLVLRAGLNASAKAVQTRTEEFLKSEVFNLSRRCSPERLAEIFAMIDTIVFEIDSAHPLPEEIKGLLYVQERPHVLLLTFNPAIGESWSREIPEVHWTISTDPREAQEILQTESIDLMMLDLITKRLEPDYSEKSMNSTMSQFDHAPYASSGLEMYRDMLASVREVRPDIPCFLIDFVNSLTGQASIDDELALEFTKRDTIRGIIETDFGFSQEKNNEQGSQQLAKKIGEIARVIRMDKLTRDPSFPYEALLFETAPLISRSTRAMRMRLRNLRLVPRSGSLDLPPRKRETEPVRGVARPSSPVDWVGEGDGQILEPQPVVPETDPRVSSASASDTSGFSWDGDAGQSLHPGPLDAEPGTAHREEASTRNLHGGMEPEPVGDTHEQAHVRKEGTAQAGTPATPGPQAHEEPAKKEDAKKEEPQKEPEPFRFSWD